MADRDQYLAQMEARLDELHAKIYELEARARRWKALVARDCSARLAAMKDKRNAAAQQLKEMRAASAASWETLKASAELTWDDLQKTIEESQQVFAEANSGDGQSRFQTGAG